MKKLGLVIVVIFLAWGLIPQRGTAQLGYQPPRRANPKDVYCSGFISATQLPANLRIVMAEDAVGRVMYSQHDYIYLGQGQNSGVQVGQRYLVVRPVRDPDDVQAFDRQRAILRGLGELYQDIGRVEVTGVHPTTATAVVTQVCDAVNAGDILIPFEERPAPDYKPSEAFDRFAPLSGKTQGTILLGKDFGHVMGQGDVIYVNLGSGQGVKVGDYFRVFRAASGVLYEGYRKMGHGHPRTYRGVPYGYEIPKMRPDLPQEVVGEAFVVRVDQNTSTAVITLSLREVHAGDYVEVEPPAAPQAQLNVSPTSIPRGGTATLTWMTQAAREASLEPGLGSVARQGSTIVSPTETTTYRLSAQGPGGTADATATLIVTQPPPQAQAPRAPPPAAARAPSLAELFAQNVQDIFFEFNRTRITEESAARLQRTAEFLRAYPQARVLIEGHCDEIGTDEYNMTLGERRAEATRDALVSLGVNGEQLRTASQGRQRPFCTQSKAESCRQLNRRAHFILQ